MADAPEPSPGGHAGKFGFLARRLGPVPIWLIAVALIAAYYWYTHYGPGAKSAANAQQNTPYGTDANGNPVIPTISESFSSSGGPSSFTETGETDSDGTPGKPKPRPRPRPRPGPRPRPRPRPRRGHGRSQTGRRSDEPLAPLTPGHTLTPLNERSDEPLVPLAPGHALKPLKERPSRHRPAPGPQDVDLDTPSGENISAHQGRWQNSEKLSIPVTAQTAQSTDQAGNPTVDIIPYRPLGM